MKRQKGPAIFTPASPLTPLLPLRWLALILIPASIHEAIQLGIAYPPFEKFDALFALVLADVREELVDRLATDALTT